jgi:hypothetical protein
LQRRKLREAAQPVFFSNNQALRITEGLMELIVIGKFQLGEKLIDGIDVIHAGIAVTIDNRIFSANRFLFRC